MPKLKATLKRHRSRSRTGARKSSPMEQNERHCAVPRCGRRSFARGMCQTHHRQLLTTGMVNPIRAYRKRSAGTVKFAGLRLSASCVETVKAFAKARGISDGAAVAQLLEDWNVKGAPWPVRDDD